MSTSIAEAAAALMGGALTAAEAIAALLARCFGVRGECATKRRRSLTNEGWFTLQKPPLERLSHIPEADMPLD